MKNIEKTYSASEDDGFVTISLEDTRDAYEYQDALGEIGNIYITRSRADILPNTDTSEEDIIRLRNEKLQQSFREIFGTAEYDTETDEYYKAILAMIANGRLASLGYAKREEIDIYNDYQAFSSSRRRH